MTKIIDPHIHLFDLLQGDYHWLKKENPPYWPDKNLITHSFTEKDLHLNKNSQLAGFVHIEAGFDNIKPWREIAWLEATCQLPFKTVASIDLTLKPELFIQQIEQLLSYTSVVGCRHILDDEACKLLAQKNVQTNLVHLALKELSFDLQMSLSDSSALSLLTNIIKQCPHLKLIINHAGWPPYFEGEHEQEVIWQKWLSGLLSLSKFSQCAIKCSGWEMVNRQYSNKWQQRIIKQCVHAFGDQRVMFASNFPLTLFNKTYSELWQSDYQLNDFYTEQQLTAFTYQNAVNWYKLAVS